MKAKRRSVLQNQDSTLQILLGGIYSSTKLDPEMVYVPLQCAVMKGEKCQNERKTTAAGTGRDESVSDEG
jgi:hypothetical protein